MNVRQATAAAALTLGALYAYVAQAPAHADPVTHSQVRPLCPQGEDDNGRIPAALNCQMWITGTVGDDDRNGVVSEDESGWASIRKNY